MKKTFLILLAAFALAATQVSCKKDTNPSAPSGGGNPPADTATPSSGSATPSGSPTITVTSTPTDSTTPSSTASFTAGLSPSYTPTDSPTGTPTATPTLACTLVIPGGSGVTLANNTYNLCSVWVQAGATLVVGGAVTINVTGDFTVDGAVDGTGNGYGSAYMPAGGPGKGGIATSITGAGGGGHGGAGGNACTSAGGAANDSEMDPADMGSASGLSYASPSSGCGGAALVVNAPNGTIGVNGSLAMNGNAGSNSIGHGGGGGAGGSLSLNSLNITGSGTMQARGGQGALGNVDYGAGGGGGGRIRICASNQPSFSPAIDVSGGSGWFGLLGCYGSDGDLGTVYDCSGVFNLTPTLTGTPTATRTSTPTATPFRHTILIDGVNDFVDANERFTTTTAITDYRAYISWDDANVYIGYSGPDVGSGSSHKWIVTFFDADGASSGASTGVAFNTQSASFPTGFRADYAYAWRASNDYTLQNAYNGSSWVPADLAGSTVLNGTYVEMGIPLSKLGSPSQLGIVTYCVDDTDVFEWTYAGLYADNFADGYFSLIPLSKYLSADFTSSLPPNDPNNKMP